MKTLKSRVSPLLAAVAAFAVQASKSPAVQMAVCAGVLTVVSAVAAHATPTPTIDVTPLVTGARDELKLQIPAVLPLVAVIMGSFIALGLAWKFIKRAAHS